MKRDNKKLIIWIFVIIVIIVVVCVLVPLIRKSRLNAKIQAEMQTLRETPAAEYCENVWWKLDIKVDEMSGVYWMCNFDDWSACEIIEYFRWECFSASEEKERESLYCSDWDNCEEDVEGLNNWIDNINGIEIEDDEFVETGDIDEVDDLDDVDIDALYEYYENEFTSTGDWIETL
jgi:putative hemolysin